MNHSIGWRHLSLRKRIHQKKEKFPSKKPPVRIMDMLIYSTVILSPLLNLPQLFKIWIQNNAQGVSVISWFGFSIISIIWLLYGIVHKEKPIIMLNSLLIGIQILIATGALIYS